MEIRTADVTALTDAELHALIREFGDGADRFGDGGAVAEMDLRGELHRRVPFLSGIHVALVASMEADAGGDVLSGYAAATSAATVAIRELYERSRAALLGR